MICKALRNLAWLKVALILAIGAVPLGGLMTPPPALSESETPSLTLRAPEPPVTALFGNPGVRLEKQAQSHRLAWYKPGQSTRLSVVVQHPTPRLRTQTARSFRSFARRLLHPGHVKPHPVDEPSNPLLS